MNSNYRLRQWTSRCVPQRQLPVAYGPGVIEILAPTPGGDKPRPLWGHRRVLVVSCRAALS